MSEAPPVETSPARLSRQEWLERALVVIGRRGTGWIGIHELVEELGVTKGSFYWHFKGREDFVSALLDHWVEEFTGRIPSLIDSKESSAEDRLLALAEMIGNEELARLEIAIRAWALEEEEAAEAVRRADGIRHDYVESLFRELGFEGDDLEMRTRTFVVYYSFDQSLSLVESDKDRHRRNRERVEILIRRG